MEENKVGNFLGKWTEKILGPKWNYRLRYYHQRGHFPNLKHPQDMSEILINLMFDEDECKKLTPYVDKLKVRDYVTEKGLGNILLKHFGVWDKPEDVPFDELPNKFVLKSNNGTGNHVICPDKTKLDRSKAIETLNYAIEFGKHHVEAHYTYIEPKVFAEELIETPDGELPIDYKFTCIGGEIMDVFVATERAYGTKYCTLDLDWNQLPYTKPEYMPKSIPPKPKHLKEMVEVAKILSKDFGLVRVDLYEYRDQPYISELTFFPWGALLYSYTDEAIKLYGKKWHQATGK